MVQMLISSILMIILTFSKMKEKGVVLNLHYIPVYLQPYYRQLGFKAGDFPISEQYYHEAITLPLYYDLTDEE